MSELLQTVMFGVEMSPQIDNNQSLLISLLYMLFLSDLLRRRWWKYLLHHLPVKYVWHVCISNVTGMNEEIVVTRWSNIWALKNKFKQDVTHTCPTGTFSSLHMCVWQCETKELHNSTYQIHHVCKYSWEDWTLLPAECVLIWNLTFLLNRDYRREPNVSTCLQPLKAKRPCEQQGQTLPEVLLKDTSTLLQFGCIFSSFGHHL